MQTLRASPLWGKILPGFLAAILLIFAIPAPARAAIDGAAICSFLGVGVGKAAATGGAAQGLVAAGTAASASMLAVPNFDLWNAEIHSLGVPFVANTSVQETAATNKTCWDVMTTAILKTVINLVRDMTIRWISTGRFEMPVFSTSFGVDVAKSAENAARLYLTGITGIDFCAGFSVPSPSAFSFGLNLGLTCTLPGEYDVEVLYNPEKRSDFDRYVANLPENEYGQTLLRTAQAKAEAEARAASNFAADYLAGQSFLSIKDPKTGKTITPGSAVARLVMEQTIVSPARQTDVANTTQQAIAAIIDTAIRTIIEKGLAATF